MISRIMIVFLICQGIEEIAVVVFQCSPVQRAWLPSAQGKCLNLYPFFWSAFGIKLATDLIIFCLPVPPLWRMKLRRGKKFGIIIMFLLGLLHVHLGAASTSNSGFADEIDRVCITSIVRMTYLKNAGHDFTCGIPLYRTQWTLTFANLQRGSCSATQLVSN